MKEFTLYLLFLCAFFAFSHAVFAQKSEASAKAAELITQGRIKDANAVLDKAVGQNQDLYAVYKMRGALKRMTGDFEGALADYSLALEQKADDAELYEQRAMMRLYTRKDPLLIRADLDATIANGRKHEKVYATRAMIRAQLRDYEGAISDYETAIGLRPDFAGAYVGLAGVYGIKRNEEKSIEVLENFIAMVENSGSKTEPVNGEVVATGGALKVPTVPGEKTPVIMEGSVIEGAKSVFLLKAARLSFPDR